MLESASIRKVGKENPTVNEQFESAPRLANLFRLSSATPLVLAADAFYILRHGQTDGNLAQRIQPIDQSLNATGFAQAHAAAAAIKGHRVASIHASTMLRAWQTAQVVSQALSLPVHEAPLLREKWFGDWVGQSSVDLDWDTVPPNGESLPDFIGRTRQGVAQALQAGGNDTLLVAHGGTVHVLLAALRLGITVEMKENATPIRIVRDGDGWHASVLVTRP